MRSCASALAALLLAAAPAAAQQHEPPNAALLVAKPGLTDPNFRETVVLVTQTPDAHTVGVILNRPGVGGPVMPQTTVALFHMTQPPAHAAFHVLQHVYLSMHPANIDALVAAPVEKMRFFAGFAGWAPRQLEAELAADGWYVMPASEALVFRKNTGGLWRELIEKARAPARRVILAP